MEERALEARALEAREGHPAAWYEMATAAQQAPDVSAPAARGAVVDMAVAAAQQGWRTLSREGAAAGTADFEQAG